MTDTSTPDAPVFGPTVCRCTGHEWVQAPPDDADRDRECRRCGASDDADRLDISPRLLAVGVAVGVLVGALLTTGFLMYSTGF
ncbi:hypothetical protein [Halomarina ordinaria]|uniref:Uncharacterized protein n=1 Tax=Halomarina ordinaria TaxID=3033939 RepID=A0ABD5U7H8_9EURY|nr:hypothetical protein [Halomarina sp. PSRA2]